MRVSQTGLDLIKYFEGRELESYPDIAGIWTIGYGHTGPDVQRGQVITEAEAEEILRQDLAKFEQGVSGLVNVDVDQNQFDALVSLTFNIGLGAFKDSTVLRELNGRNYLAAAEAITWWNKATVNGVKREVLGLTRRRAAEAALFLQDVGAGEAGPVKDDSTRIQPEENPPRRGNIAGSRTIEGSVVAGAGGVVGVGAAMMDDDEPEATQQGEPGDTEAHTEPPVSEPGPATEPVSQTVPAPDSATETTTEVGAPPADTPTISRAEYKEAIQIAAGVVVVLAVLYIIWARIDDWRNYRR